MTQTAPNSIRITSSLRLATVIVAGGSGVRMGGAVPKQFLLLNSRPVLMYTLDAFYRFSQAMQLVVVLPESQIDYWQQLCKEFDFQTPHQIAVGGAERFYSVKNGLALCADADIVAVHDGVRPFVDSGVIGRCFDAAIRHGAAVAAIPVVDSLRFRDEKGSNHAVDRANYLAVQTPQAFRNDWLRDAYGQDFNAGFTDDASVVEAAGHAIVMVEGSRENFKITNQLDLLVGEAILATKS